MLSSSLVFMQANQIAALSYLHSYHSKIAPIKVRPHFPHPGMGGSIGGDLTVITMHQGQNFKSIWSQDMAYNVTEKKNRE